MVYILIALYLIPGIITATFLAYYLKEYKEYRTVGKFISHTLIWPVVLLTLYIGAMRRYFSKSR